MNDSPEYQKTIKQIQSAITSATKAANKARCTLAIVGGNSKPALQARSYGSSSTNPHQGSELAAEKSGSEPVGQLNISELSGIIDYQPAEFTITAYAGTPVAELNAALAQHQQYLPFDPPLVTPTIGAATATIGGAVASGINGAGRWRYGGVRDFILETRFIDGTGEIRTGGRRVVKNAAGFDIPKLMVGSCGRLGPILDLTLKVFPKPRDYMTIHVFSDNLETAAANISNIGMMPWEIDAIEIQPDFSLLIRLSGDANVLNQHGSRLQKSVRDSCSDFLLGHDQDKVWQARQDWIWNDADQFVLRVPLNLRTMLDLDEELEELEIDRCYGSAGNVAWLKWKPNLETPGARLKKVAKILVQFGLTGLLVRIPEHAMEVSTSLIIGADRNNMFYQKIKSTFDPHQLFGDLYDS